MKRPAADCEVRGGSATHDLDSRSIKKLNAEEEEEMPSCMKTVDKWRLDKGYMKKKTYQYVIFKK